MRKIYQDAGSSPPRWHQFLLRLGDFEIDLHISLLQAEIGSPQVNHWKCQHKKCSESTVFLDDNFVAQLFFLRIFLVGGWTKPIFKNMRKSNWIIFPGFRGENPPKNDWVKPPPRPRFPCPKPAKDTWCHERIATRAVRKFVQRMRNRRQEGPREAGKPQGCGHSHGVSEVPTPQEIAGLMIRDYENPLVSLNKAG